jgi:hypothetical protein
MWIPKTERMRLYSNFSARHLSGIIIEGIGARQPLYRELGLDAFWAERLLPSRKGTRWDLVLLILWWCTGCSPRVVSGGCIGSGMAGARWRKSAALTSHGLFYPTQAKDRTRQCLRRSSPPRPRLSLNLLLDEFPVLLIREDPQYS